MTDTFTSEKVPALVDVACIVTEFPAGATTTNGDERLLAEASPTRPDAALAPATAEHLKYVPADGVTPVPAVVTVPVAVAATVPAATSAAAHVIVIVPTQVRPAGTVITVVAPVVAVNVWNPDSILVDETGPEDTGSSKDVPSGLVPDTIMARALPGDPCS